LKRGKRVIITATKRPGEPSHTPIAWFDSHASLHTL
jgi:hypothetical protein